MCPGPGSAVDADRAAQSLDAVGQAGQAGTARGIGSADSVVADRQQQAAVARGERNLDARGLRMLHRVGQRLGRDVVRRDLDRLGIPRIRRHGKVDRYRGPAGERAQRRAQTTLGQDRRVDPAGELLQFGHRVGQSRRDPGQLSPQVVPVGAVQLQQLSGLEILAAQLEGKIPPAPIDRYAGIRLIEAEDGRVVFSLPAHSGLVQELETVFGGVIALLAKSASGAAVQTIAPAGTGFTALDLKVNFLRPTRVEGEELIATASITHRGRKLSIANAVVTYRGRRIAIATGTTALTPPE